MEYLVYKNDEVVEGLSFEEASFELAMSQLYRYLIDKVSNSDSMRWKMAGVIWVQTPTGHDNEYTVKENTAL